MCECGLNRDLKKNGRMPYLCVCGEAWFYMVVGLTYEFVGE